jgi:sigma-B regulation protein RsbU (phosphoserine phosphatase)
MKVLIADDRPREAKLLEALVRDLGHEVTVARDGLEAIRLLTSEAPPDAVLLDWLMPGMDGASLCRWIRSHLDAKLPHVVIITGRGGASLQQTAQQAGVNSVIAKPWRAQQIRHELAQAAAQLPAVPVAS